MQNQKLLVAAAAAIALAIVAGCTTSVPAPVQDRNARPTLPQQPQVLQAGPIVVSPANPAYPANSALPGNTAGSQFHVVQRGETLYGIARVNNIDINALAAWNGIATTQPLRDGQVLRLQPTRDTTGALPAMSPGATTASGVPGATLTPIPATGSIQGQPLPSGPTPVITSVTPIFTPVSPVEAPLKREPKSQRLPYSDAALAAMKQSESGVVPVMPPGAAASAPASTMSPSLGSLPGATAAPAIPAPTSVAAAPNVPAAPIEAEIKPGAGVDRDGIAWTWPTSGKVASKFNDKAPMKGIDIAANAGTPVVAAAAGKVIYVGKEPRGFGQMIVVSHAKETVSVYFHTDKLLVKEQQRVLIGQRLAEVGDSAGNKMHFEVRRQGRPLDPISLMPR